MTEIREEDIRELEPYADSDVPAALERLLGSPLLEKVRSAYFPALAKEKFAQVVRSSRGSLEFQHKVIGPAINAMLDATSDGFTISGFEDLDKDGKYTFISNHRDIVCDPALFTWGIVQQGLESPLICLGDNLLKTPWIVDLIKVNRGVTVKRNLSQRELLKWSQTLSALLNRAVTRGAYSVWVAQREGRAKDGNDQTHSGVIKMLTLSREQSVAEKARGLRIVPISVSYEYDPCDALKARELHYARTPEGYRKRPGEDELSMALGIQGQKGRIHIEIGEELAPAVARASQLSSRREQVDVLVEDVDRQIHSTYRLWPSNYISFDMLEEGETYRSRYSADDRAFFIERMERQIAGLNESVEQRESITLRFLEMYANPVRNARKWISGSTGEAGEGETQGRTRRLSAVPSGIG